MGGRVPRVKTGSRLPQISRNLILHMSVWTPLSFRLMSLHIELSLGCKKYIEFGSSANVAELVYVYTTRSYDVRLGPSGKISFCFQECMNYILIIKFFNSLPRSQSFQPLVGFVLALWLLERYICLLPFAVEEDSLTQFGSAPNRPARHFRRSWSLARTISWRPRNKMVTLWHRSAIHLDLVYRQNFMRFQPGNSWKRPGIAASTFWSGHACSAEWSRTPKCCTITLTNSNQTTVLTISHCRSTTLITSWPLAVLTP